MSAIEPAVREFAVTTNYQIEALKPGGLSREAALRQAEHNLEELRLRFPKALNEQIDGLWQAIDRAQGGDPAWREPFKLRCLDLSDAATTIGYGLVAFVASSLRQACDAEAFETRRIAIMQGHIDAMNHYGSDTYENLSVEDVPGIAEELRRIVAST